MISASTCPCEWPQGSPAFLPHFTQWFPRCSNFVVQVGCEFERGSAAETMPQAVIKGGAMKAPRSQSRRDFNVATAGWFTVLKTASRTVTLRPFGAYRSFANPSSGPDASPETPKLLADRLSTMKIPLIGEIGMIDRG